MANRPMAKPAKSGQFEVATIRNTTRVSASAIRSTAQTVRTTRRASGTRRATSAVRISSPR